MNNTLYTNGAKDFFFVDQAIPVNIISTPAEDSSSDIFSSYPSTRSAPQIWWLPLNPWIMRKSYSKDAHESFMGMLEPGEADRMRGEWELYKKQLNDSFARKNEILFGH